MYLIIYFSFTELVLCECWDAKGKNKEVAEISELNLSCEIFISGPWEPGEGTTV